MPAGAGPGAELQRAPLSLDDCQLDAPADLFFLHGTMEWKGNRASIGRYEQEVWQGFNTHHQMTMLTAFTSSCRAFAPLYRQAGAAGNWDLAYQDVARAFEQFLADTGTGRPIVLAGHSQGSMHLSRLMRERVAGDPALLARVAAVFAPGTGAWTDPSPLVVEDGTATASNAPARPESLRTVAIWCTATPAAQRSRTLVGRMSAGEPLPCADPARWAGGKGVLLRDVDTGRPILMRGLIEQTEVQDGLVRVHPYPGGVPILEKLHFGHQDYHAYDIHLFWADVRERVRHQVYAWQEMAVC